MHLCGSLGTGLFSSIFLRTTHWNPYFCCLEYIGIWHLGLKNASRLANPTLSPSCQVLAAAILSRSMWVPPSFHCGPCPGIERRGAGAAPAPCRHPSRALAWRSFRWMEALNMWKCQRWLALTRQISLLFSHVSLFSLLMISLVFSYCFPIMSLFLNFSVSIRILLFLYLYPQDNWENEMSLMTKWCAPQMPRLVGKMY